MTVAYVAFQIVPRAEPICRILCTMKPPEAPAELNDLLKSEANTSLSRDGPRATRAKFSHGISSVTQSRVD